MDSANISRQSYAHVQNVATSPDSEHQPSSSSSSQSGKDETIVDQVETRERLARVVVILPLIFHALFSIAIAATFTFYLDQSQYYLQRHPTVTLVDGTSFTLDSYHILQSDVTTLISVSLMLLRWIAAAWAGPLCWRVIFLLAEKYGVRRQDIRWASNRGVLPASTHHQYPLALLLGVILLVTAVPQPAPPILTGSIAWQPSMSRSSEISSVSHRPTINLTGKWPETDARTISATPPYISDASFAVSATRNYIIAGEAPDEDYAFKRVIPTVAGLNINTTIANVILPYISVTNLEWLKDPPGELYDELNSRLVRTSNEGNQRIAEAHQAGVILLARYPKITFEYPLDSVILPKRTWLLALRNNPAGAEFYCQPTKGLFYNWTLGNCYSFARVSFLVGFGNCTDCLLTSGTVVQNVTKLSLSSGGEQAVGAALLKMPSIIPGMTPLAASLPSPETQPNQYVTRFLALVYSAAWNAWTDMYLPIEDNETPVSSEYSPAFPRLRAQVDHGRVYTWLGMQLTFTLAGLAFLYLQSSSEYPLIKDTAMMAFDLDTTEVPKPHPLENSEPGDLLRFERDGEGWKATVVNPELRRRL